LVNLRKNKGGFIIGLAASMLGGGGGFFFPPLLILLFGVPAQIAVATSLAATLPICIVGSVGHYRNGNIDLKMGMVFGMAGIIGAHFLVGEIDLTLVYFLAGGAIFGAFAGSRFLGKVKIGRAEGHIKQWFAIALAVFGIILIIS
jgi:uncharacterized membrane protein YfcA